MKQCKFIGAAKSSSNDDRCYFEDESNKILYIFGPSHYMRSGFESKEQTEIAVIEFEGGPYIGIGDEVLSSKYAISIGLTYDHDVPVVSIQYDSSPKPKKKKKKRQKNK